MSNQSITQPINLQSAAYMGHEIPMSHHVSFAVRMQRADFQAQPPALQRETMERVQRIVAERPNSYLAKHWREMYRVGL